MFLAITTYNQIKFTRKCLDSLPHISGLETVIFDDCSTDGTQNLEGVISKDKGKGLTDSWNAAYRYFLKSDHEHFFLANNDILIPQGALEEMVKCLEDVPLCVPLTSKRGAGNASTRQDVIAYHNIRYNPDDPENIQKIQDYIGGMASPRVAIGKLNGFFFGMSRDIINYQYGKGLLVNPKYINVGNDNDLNGRLRAQEAETIVCTKAFVFHFKDRTFRWEKHRVHRNNLGYYRTAE